MIQSDVFYARMAICQQCPHWRNVCLKGHGLASPLGCPERRFPGVEGAGYMEDQPAAKPVEDVAGVMPCCGGTVAEEVKELTYVEAVQHLMQDLKVWREANYPLLAEEPYLARIATCKSCPGGFYRFFQCRACKCIIYSKAKLKTTVCPGGYWPPV